VRKTVVETDASDFALGCVLWQYQGRRLHPVAFHFRKLNSAERNYEIHDKELLAIMEAFKEWKRYLWGEEEPLTVYTDHQNLQSLLTKKVWHQRQIRWAPELTNYNFKIVYRPGSRGGKHDVLSRRLEYRPEKGARTVNFEKRRFSNFDNLSKTEDGDGPHAGKRRIDKADNNETLGQENKSN